MKFKAGDKIRRVQDEVSWAPIGFETVVTADGNRYVSKDGPAYLIVPHQWELVEEPMPKVDLTPGSKYTHPRWAKVRDGRHFFYLVGTFRNGSAIIEYEDGCSFFITEKELSEIKPYSEPVRHVRYYNMHSDSVSSGYVSKAKAEHAALPTRIGCKRVEFLEGEYDA